jgi:hypothetical protein
MKREMNAIKWIVSVVLVLIFAAGIIVGVSLGDTAECELHGSTICLSCMGIE